MRVTLDKTQTASDQLRSVDMGEAARLSRMIEGCKEEYETAKRTTTKDWKSRPSARLSPMTSLMMIHLNFIACLNTIVLREQERKMSVVVRLLHAFPSRLYRVTVLQSIYVSPDYPLFVNTCCIVDDHHHESEELKIERKRWQRWVPRQPRLPHNSG